MYTFESTWLTLNVSPVTFIPLTFVRSRNRDKYLFVEWITVCCSLFHFRFCPCCKCIWKQKKISFFFSSLYLVLFCMWIRTLWHLIRVILLDMKCWLKFCQVNDTIEHVKNKKKSQSERMKDAEVSKEIPFRLP